MAGAEMAADDPLSSESRGAPKSMIDVGGRTILQRVVDAVGGAPSVDGVVIVAAPGIVQPDCAVPLVMVPAAGDAVDNLLAGAAKVRELAPGVTQVLLVPADLPLLLAEHVEWMAGHVRAHPADVHYGIGSKQLMDAAFPNCGQPFVRVRGGTYCGGDLHALLLDALDRHQDVWRALLADRKHAVRQARALGIVTMVLALLRLLTAEQVAARASRSLGMHLAVVHLPWAEAAMDVDGPENLAMVRARFSPLPTPSPAPR